MASLGVELLRSLARPVRTITIRGYSAGVITAAPDVYTKPPPQTSLVKPGQLTIDQVEQYFHDGFLVVPKFFDDNELNPVLKAIENCVDILADKLYHGGKIKDKAENSGVFQRLIHLEDQFPGANILLFKVVSHLPVPFQQLWEDERLLNVVEQFLGPDIAGHPVWNLRTKTPCNEEVTVPWHQDNAYLEPSCLATLQVTAWIPLLDATKENGCMQVVRGGHRKGITATHTCCAGNTWYVDLAEEEMEKTLGVDMSKDVVTCEFPKGGVLFLNNAIPHRSLQNYSKDTRWSIDLRWQKPDLPNGFYNLKDCITMRKANDPSFKADWSVFAGQDRNKLQDKVSLTKDVGEDEFSTIVTGPWMRRWKITNENRHTRALTNTTTSD